MMPFGVIVGSGSVGVDGADMIRTCREQIHCASQSARKDCRGGSIAEGIRDHISLSSGYHQGTGGGRLGPGGGGDGARGGGASRRPCTQWQPWRRRWAMVSLSTPTAVTSRCRLAARARIALTTASALKCLPEFLDEAAVDFQAGEGLLVKRGEGGVACAEMVEHQAGAGSSQGQECHHGARVSSLSTASGTSMPRSSGFSPVLRNMAVMRAGRLMSRSCRGRG